MVVKVETLVVGAGVIGSSVAMHLAKLGMKDIRVIDFDLEGSLSSSELNAGGVRATFVQPINIDISKFSIEYFASVAAEVGYRDCGYLWLHNEKQLPKALQTRELQVQRGWPVEVWDVAELKRRVPFIDKTSDIAKATFASRDGLINPNLLKNHFRSQSKALGVVYEDRVFLKQTNYLEPSQGIHIIGEKFQNTISPENKVKIAQKDFSSLDRVQVEYRVQRVVNCAGPWASEVARILGYSSPSYPLRRQVSIFDCRGLDLTPYGMMIDTSGVYFHPEGTNGLAGFATPKEEKGFNFLYEGEDFFTEHIWQPLYERSTYFERLKHVTGWAGLYEVSPDDCAIVGQVNQGEAGKFRNVFEAHSFSGHGVMQSHGAGLALAEKIIHGKYLTLDLSPLSADRFVSNQLIHENLVI